MTQGNLNEIADFMPEPTDMVLYLRNGNPVIHAPKNDGGLVPDDFLILVAIAASWHDPGFRDRMMAKVQTMIADGALDSMVKRSDTRPH